MDRMILFGEASLRRSLREYITHFRSERNHQGLGNRLLEPIATVSTIDEPIPCRTPCRMLNFYYREADTNDTRFIYCTLRANAVFTESEAYKR